MNINEVITTARDSLTVKRVYGDPYETNGLTVIPAASVIGGAGGGAGHDVKGQDGEGGGFGVSARPAGAYVIKDGEVTWHAALNVNRLVTAVGLAMVILLLTRSRNAKVHASRLAT